MDLTLLSLTIKVFEFEFSLSLTEECMLLFFLVFFLDLVVLCVCRHISHIIMIELILFCNIHNDCWFALIYFMFV